MNGDPSGPSAPGTPYPPIGDYGFLSDGRCVALVSRWGSIDWCCMPRADHGSSFGRVLDWDDGGHCTFAPVAPTHSEREYVDGSLVLRTRLSSADGAVQLTDCVVRTEASAGGGSGELVRVLECLRGSVPCELRVAVRFDYADLRPWLRRHHHQVVSAIGGDDGLVVWCDAGVDVDGNDLTQQFTLSEGDTARLSLRWLAPQDIPMGPHVPPRPNDLDDRVGATLSWWRAWSDADARNGELDPAVRRSATVLRGLVDDRTGAIMAAPTTSLPEAIGGSRNWDYRYSWIRDSQFTVRSLATLGWDGEADAFRRFVERSAAGDAASLQVAYGLGGERRLPEQELDHLEGYRRSAPVRLGNVASSQLQLDVFGYVLDLAGRWHERGFSPDDDYWRFLVAVVETAAELWDQPDRGIWEIRGTPQHFVHSKAMCWAALDRGISLAEQCARAAPLDRWRDTRRAIRRAVEADGFDEERGVFVATFAGHDVDPALLLLPSVGFLPYEDERIIRTADAVRDDLSEGGLIRRRTNDDATDDAEGVFVACSFWLAECYARQDRHDEARVVYQRALAAANDLGLFSEELDPRTGELLGNFPQGLTHLSHIAAAVALGVAGGAGGPSGARADGIHAVETAPATSAGRGSVPWTSS